MTRESEESIYNDLVGRLVIVRLNERNPTGRADYCARLVAVQGNKLMFESKSGRLWIESEWNIKSIIIKYVCEV